MFLLGHSRETTPKVLFDPITLENIFTYKSDRTLSNDEYTPTDYFVNGEVFHDLRSYNFTFYGFTKEE